ncbi:hypothetical protein WSK_3476 [Novosphingobium sp. Rr 2-17]|nr:hypothetical protein WSK_3476 [Novosphingobium sp. Rr 2-17]
MILFSNILHDFFTYIITIAPQFIVTFFHLSINYLKGPPIYNNNGIYIVTMKDDLV